MSQNRVAAVLLVVFAVLWLVSLDQYVFIPLLAVVSYLRADGPPQLRGPAPLVLALAGVVLLGLVAVVFSDYLSNAVRTANVWGSALLLLLAACSGGRRSTSIIVRTLLGVWLASMLVYAVGQLAPTVTDTLLDLKLSSGPASSRGFWDETSMFGVQVNRPVGFALYANELALFGLVIAGLYLWHERPTSRLWSAFLVLLAFTGVVLSTSRTLVLTVAAALLVLWAMRPHPRAANRWLARATATTSLISAVLLLLLAVPDLADVIRTDLDTVAGARVGASSSLRETAYSAGLDIARRNPWTGVGGLPSTGVIQAGSHNLPLSMLVRHGIPGLLLLLVVLVAVAVAAIRGLLRNEPYAGLVGMGLLVAVVSSLTIQFDDDILPFAGVVVATALLLEPSEEAEQPSPTGGADAVVPGGRRAEPVAL